ncbi:uncharacterized protein FTOL_13850 [Fusarium torulosum]|uniref:Uncharacterized protein n=1 Tax=Fusarium torulosum TaxID=33205 RepID=A0AAE8MN89_9HYPO|nr:uncharacterized protein FTOL_13850 [Fusarium torulosum]
MPPIELIDWPGVPGSAAPVGWSVMELAIWSCTTGDPGWLSCTSFVVNIVTPQKSWASKGTKSEMETD